MKDNELKLTRIMFYFENCEDITVPIENFSQLFLNNIDILHSNYETLQTIHNTITTGDITFEDNHNLESSCYELNRNPLNRFKEVNDLVGIDLICESNIDKDRIELTIKWFYENEDDSYEEQYENNNVIVTSPNYYTINMVIKPYTKIYLLNELHNSNYYIGNEFEDIVIKDRYILSNVNEFNSPILMPIPNRCQYNFTSGKYTRINGCNLFDVQYELIKVKKVDFVQLIDYMNIINLEMLELKLDDKIKAQPNTVYYTMDNHSDYIVIGEYNETKRWLHGIYELDIEDLDEWFIK